MPLSINEKTMADILAFDDGIRDEEAFVPVRQLSEATDQIYRTMFSPWIRMLNTPAAAETIRQLHPLRTSRCLFSDLNPWMWTVPFWAGLIKEKRVQHKPVFADNPYINWEKSMSQMIINGLDQFREVRDGCSELMFKAMYENGWSKTMSALYADAVIKPSSL